MLQNEREIDMDLKQKILVGLTQDDTFLIEFDVKRQDDVTADSVAYILLQEAVEKLAESMHVPPEFLAESMFHDFTKGKYISDKWE